MAVPGLKNKTLKWKSKITCFLFLQKRRRKKRVSKIDNYYKKEFNYQAFRRSLVYQTMLMKIKLPPIIKMVFFILIKKKAQQRIAKTIAIK
jgi:hypothetical protein